MRICVLVLVLAAACGSNNKDKLPVGGGGGGGGTGLVDSPPPPVPDAPRPDAAIDAVPDSSIDAAFATGKVCLVLDPRALTEVVKPIAPNATVCDTTNAGGLRVEIGGQTATTNPDGTFTIVGAPTSGELWHVTGANIVDSWMFADDFEIPAITKTMYASMISGSGVSLPFPGEGSIILQVVHDDAGYPGVKLASQQVSNASPRYDGSSPTAWTDGGTTGTTGAHGAAWFAGLDVGDGTATVTATDGNSVQISTPALPVFDGAITFADIVYP